MHGVCPRLNYKPSNWKVWKKRVARLVSTLKDAPSPFALQQRVLELNAVTRADFCMMHELALRFIYRFWNVEDCKTWMCNDADLTLQNMAWSAHVYDLNDCNVTELGEWGVPNCVLRTLKTPSAIPWMLERASSCSVPEEIWHARSKTVSVPPETYDSFFRHVQPAMMRLRFPSRLPEFDCAVDVRAELKQWFDVWNKIHAARLHVLPSLWETEQLRLQLLGKQERLVVEEGGEGGGDSLQYVHRCQITNAPVKLNETLVVCILRDRYICKNHIAKDLMYSELVTRKVDKELVERILLTPEWEFRSACAMIHNNV